VLTNAELAAVATDLVEWESLNEDWPLATVKLWHRTGEIDVADEIGPDFVDALGAKVKRTSQRTAVAQLASNRTVVIGGGNRSGKTFGTKCAFVALGLGSDHPMARAFWEMNGIDPDSFPKGPANADHGDGEAWVVAVDYNASKEYHRSSIETLLAPGSYRWSMRNASAAAELYVKCPGYDYEAVFRFKSDGANARKRMQGQKCRVVWHDEEGPSEEAWDECCTRLTDANGWHILSNTPVDGLTWVEDRLIAKTGPTAELDAVTYHIHTIDNPYHTEAGLRNLRKGDRRMRMAKMFGRAVSRLGLVYPLFDPNVHVVAPFDIPADWPRYKAVDFGTRNPFACIWAAEDPDGRLIVYREYYKAEATLRTHALNLYRLEGWDVDEGEGTWEAVGPVEDFDVSWADPEDPQQMMQLIRDYGMEFRKAIKHVNLGIDAVNERLDPTQIGGPGLVFFSTCTTCIREHRGYVWAPRTNRTEPEKPVKKNDHGVDAVRYMVYGLKKGNIVVGMS